MTKATFGIYKDGQGRKYVSQAIDEQDKNHRSDSVSSDTTGEGRMYETSGDCCPVSSFELYLSKLSNIDSLWQRPLDSFLAEDRVWYCQAPVGKNTLSHMMAKISTSAKLSATYSNHGVRATCITMLDDSGIEGRHIMRVSGHKNEASIRSYACQLNDQKKRQISDTIANALHPSSSSETTKKQMVIPPTTTSNARDLEFDEETDAVLSQMPLAPSPTQISLRHDECRTNTFNFTNCNVTINYNK